MSKVPKEKMLRLSEKDGERIQTSRQTAKGMHIIGSSKHFNLADLEDAPQKGWVPHCHDFIDYVGQKCNGKYQDGIIAFACVDCPRRKPDVAVEGL